jgi:ABC-type branched-subunit amino acid transport system ATPase component
MRFLGSHERASADRAYVLKSGELEAEGPADELRRSADIERAYLGIGVS